MLHYMTERIVRPTQRARELRNSPTDAERKLWTNLSRRQLGGYKFSRQMPIGPFICDFLCRERGLVVEVDGGQHAGSKSDAARSEFLTSEGLTVIPFWNHEVLANTAGVLTTILATLDGMPSRERHPHPQPLPQAGGEYP